MEKCCVIDQHGGNGIPSIAYTSKIARLGFYVYGLPARLPRYGLGPPLAWRPHTVNPSRVTSRSSTLLPLASEGKYDEELKIAE